MLKHLILKILFTKSHNKKLQRHHQWKNFFDKAVVSDMKRYKEIRKLTTGQGEDYTTVCLFDYDFIKNHYKLIAADSSIQKELDADPKTIQQIEFVGQLKQLDCNDNAADAGDDQSIFV